VIEAKPVIILGSGGIGKTTLALAVLHDDEVAKKYSYRYFVSCDGITSMDLLLTELAVVLRMPTEAQDQYLKDRVV
jgi:predicted ATPase